MSPRYYFETDPLADMARNRRLALFLDFDGTLSRITKDHTLSCLSPVTRGLLESIAESDRSILTIISGRSLADLRKKTSLRGFYHAGSHGLEIVGPGMRFVHKAARTLRPIIDTISEDLEAAIGSRKGISIERKRYSVAVHYRGAGRISAVGLRSSLKERLAARDDFAKQLRIVRGKKVLELVPRVSWNKGAAARYIMEKVGGGYLPVCVGDDATDETLFETFRQCGLTVRIGPSRRTAAEYFLKGQWEVPVFLRRVRDLLVESGAFPRTAADGEKLSVTKE